MAFSKTPSVWLGKGYALTSSEIKLTTATHAGTSIGVFTVVAATDVITLAAHGLKVGDAVKVSSATTLPAGMAADTIYYVKTVPSENTLTLSDALNGGTLDATDTGTGNHTMFAIALPHLSDAEANASTGDVRDIIFSLLDSFWVNWNGIAVADRPTKMYLSKSTSVNDATGIATTQYNVRFEIGTIAQEVVAES